MLRRALLCSPALLLVMPALAQQRPSVVASFSILADMTRQIGGDRITLRAIAGADQDAHGFQPKPSDAAALTSAAVMIRNGLRFEIKTGLRRRNLRRMLTRQAESYRRDDPFTLSRLGDMLRAQWRGLASFVRLIPPRHRTDHPAKNTTTQPNKANHAAAPAIPMPFGIFNRKIKPYGLL